MMTIVLLDLQFQRRFGQGLNYCDPDQMKKRKQFSEFLKENTVINESQLLTKAYAIGQNAKHISTSTAINSKAAKIAALSKDAINADDIEVKINKIADALIQFSEVLKLQSNQSTAIKNVVVASALFAERNR